MSLPPVRLVLITLPASSIQCWSVSHYQSLTSCHHTTLTTTTARARNTPSSALLLPFLAPKQKHKSPRLFSFAASVASCLLAAEGSTCFIHLLRTGPSRRKLHTADGHLAVSIASASSQAFSGSSQRYRRTIFSLKCSEPLPPEYFLSGVCPGLG